jgi:CspA family cold shock protein
MAQYDNEGSRPLARTSATGKVKWFNGTKGYGFVTLDSGSDAFCHASALQAIGHSEVPQGTTIVCDLADSPRGLQVVNIHSVDLSTAEAAAPRGPRRDFGGGGGRGFRESGPSGPMVEGKIKFFNDQKGFGFVMPDSGSGDIYLHASALRRSGVQAVEPDQRIRYSTRQGIKGVEVDRVELI